MKETSDQLNIHSLKKLFKQLRPEGMYFNKLQITEDKPTTNIISKSEM